MSWNTDVSRTSSSEREQEGDLIKVTSRGDRGCVHGRDFQFYKDSPKLSTGITLSLFVLFTIGALLLVPGGMGIIGHCLETTFMAQMANTLTLPGVITMAVTGGISALLALGTLTLLAISLLKPEKGNISSSETEEEKLSEFEAYVSTLGTEDNPILKLSRTDVGHNFIKEGHYALVNFNNAWVVVYKKQHGTPKCKQLQYSEKNTSIQWMRNSKNINLEDLKPHYITSEDIRNCEIWQECYDTNNTSV